MTTPTTKALLDEAEEAAVIGPLRSGWVVQGPRVAEFEKLFGEFTGAAESIATTSCTTALHLALAALGVKPGDEVIVPAFTWISTANVVLYMGAKPVFCDIDLATFNLDVAQVAAAITPRTVGIIPVHLFGLCAEMDGLQALATKHDLWLVEDAACGFGGRIRGQHAGTFGAMGCFSFHPRKSITTGEGGMVTTQNADYARLCRSLRDHGANRTDLARHHGKTSFLLAEYDHVGYNYRMTDIQGAMGVAQMGKAKRILDGRQQWAGAYDAALADLDWLATPHVPETYEHGYQAYVCLFRPETPTLANVADLHDRRNALMSKLEARGIATRQGTHAVHIQTYYAREFGLRPEDFPTAYMADRLTLALPLYPQMTAAEFAYVVDHLHAA
ncbi:MAG: DegT/DnrJ/EryC1/StrS family aminotransferase [Candidatus Sericytochromatia bacterium]|nr:DegT/DnrJ/EryC1/StrS family aminotransferase [Candidatus Sericytochromatia bacterium]